MPDIRHDMETVLEKAVAEGRLPLAWWFTDEKRNELADALRYDDGGLPVEALGLPIRIYPGVAAIGGWGLNSTR